MAKTHIARMLVLGAALVWCGKYISEVNAVVGGQNAEQGQIPYQIQIQTDGDHVCGGSLVEIKGQQVVITTARCIIYNDNITLVAGEVSLVDNSGTEQVRNIKQKVYHTGYDFEAAANDIALLIPETPFEINDNVKTISLPQSHQQTTGDVIVSGWGYTSRLQETNILQWVQIPVVSKSKCMDIYKKENITISESTICAGVEGKDVCYGDAGGPIRAVDGDYLAGVVSVDFICGKSGFPSVNTEVSQFIDWINENIS